MTRHSRAHTPSARSARVALFAIALLVIACGRSERSRADSAQPAVSSPPAAPRTDSTSTAAAPIAIPPASAAPSCVSEGDWRPCSIEKRLTDAGFVPVNKGAAPSGLFSVPGTTYALGTSVMHIYVFPTAAALKREVATIDTVAVARRGATASWPLPPTFITSNNVAAVLVSDNDRLIERVQNAITAGLPSATR